MSTRRILGRAGSEAAGSVTFNSPATWVSPPRLLNVTVTGVGAAGEPGQVGVAGTGGAGSNVRGAPGNYGAGGQGGKGYNGVKGYGSPGNPGAPGSGAAGGGGGRPSHTGLKLACPVQLGCCRDTDDLGCGQGRHRLDAWCTRLACSGARRAAGTDGMCISGIAGRCRFAITCNHMYLHCIEPV